MVQTGHSFIIVSLVNLVNLGSLRQEVCSSGRVQIITDYVELIKERKASLHTKVVDTKKTLVENNINLDSLLHEPKEDLSNIALDFKQIFILTFAYRLAYAEFLY